MALPKLEVPTYETELPISKKKVKFRPFLVKEQKTLLMAMESGDTDFIQQSINDILEFCTLTKEINIGELPILDVEYYFIQLRSKSVGEVVESKYRCNNVVNEKTCGNIMELNWNLSNIKPQFFENDNDELQLTDKLVLKMKYPQFSIVKDSAKIENINDLTIKLIANCIEYIYDGEQFYYAKETTEEELIEFIESLNPEQFSKVEEYFNNLPKLKETVQLKCNKCGFEHSIDVEGLENFFG